MLSPRSFPRTSYGTYVYRARISSSPGRNLARVAGNNVNRDDIGRSSTRYVLYTLRRTRCGSVSLSFYLRTFSSCHSPSFADFSRYPFESFILSLSSICFSPGSHICLSSVLCFYLALSFFFIFLWFSIHVSRQLTASL